MEAGLSDEQGGALAHSLGLAVYIPPPPPLPQALPHGLTGDDVEADAALRQGLRAMLADPELRSDATAVVQGAPPSERLLAAVSDASPTKSNAGGADHATTFHSALPVSASSGSTDILGGVASPRDMTVEEREDEAKAIGARLSSALPQPIADKLRTGQPLSQPELDDLAALRVGMQTLSPVRGVLADAQMLRSPGFRASGAPPPTAKHVLAYASAGAEPLTGEHSLFELLDADADAEAASPAPYEEFDPSLCMSPHPIDTTVSAAATRSRPAKDSSGAAVGNEPRLRAPLRTLRDGEHFSGGSGEDAEAARSAVAPLPPSLADKREKRAEGEHERGQRDQHRHQQQSLLATPPATPAPKAGVPTAEASAEASAGASDSFPPLTQRRRTGLSSAVQEAARLASEARDTLTEEERLARARAFEAAEATLRPHLTAPCPRARIDTERTLLLLTPPPPAPVRVHFRLILAREAAAAASSLAAAAARSAAEAEAVSASLGPARLDELLPTAQDPFVDASGALPLPEHIEEVRGGCVVLRSFGPCRFPSRLACVPLPGRAPPPMGRFDWVGGVLRLTASRHAGAAAEGDEHVAVQQAEGGQRRPEATAREERGEADGGEHGDEGDGNDDDCHDADGNDDARALSQQLHSPPPPSLPSLVPPSCRIIYTLDPTREPPAVGSPDALEYDDLLGIPLPISSTAFPEAAAPAAGPCVTAVTLIGGLWPSEPARFEPPRRLPAPKSAILDPQTHMLSMSAPPPGVEYRYTLDGSVPSLASPCYTAPVLLPLPEEESDEVSGRGGGGGGGGGLLSSDALPLLRVVAFPSPAVPSTELTVQLGARIEADHNGRDVAFHSIGDVPLSSTLPSTADALSRGGGNVCHDLSPECLFEPA